MSHSIHLSGYKHHFASWTSARAVQRDFTSTPIIRKAIEYSGLPEGIVKVGSMKLSMKQFDEWHVQIVSKLKKGLLAELPREKLSYGRISKIVAIYIKTAHILGKPYDRLSQIAHVPVDRIMLNNLYREYKNPLFDTSLISWTKLNRTTYFKVINELRKTQSAERLKCFWMLEKYWEPV